MAGTSDAARRIFLRYTLTNILILVLPLLTSALYYRISIRAIQQSMDAATTSQLERSMTEIDRLFADIRTMAIQLGNDYEIGSYLSSPGQFTGIELYNMKRISQKLSSYVFVNGILSHAFLYLSRSDYLVFESGFSTYRDFYGTLFSCEGFTAQMWRDEILRTSGGEELFPLHTITVGGQQSRAHIYRRSIGYGDYYLGSIVGIVDESRVHELLDELPRRYGGWVSILDPHGRLIATTNPEAEELGAGGPQAAMEAGISGDTLVRGGETFRLYRLRSSVNDWTYTAVLADARVFAPVRTIRDVAFALLGLGLLVGVGAAYLVAFTNAKPLRAVIQLLLPASQGSRGRSVSVYEELEGAIVRMSESRSELEREVRSAEKMTRTYFFQNLLRGGYRDRASFDEERRLFRIELADGPHYVVVGRLAALGAASGGESYARLRDALLGAAARGTGARDFVVQASFDDVAIVKATREAARYRDEALALVEGIRSSLEPAVRGSVSFGVGTPVADPFLLAISHGEAVTAVSSATSSLFYADIPGVRSGYSYPLDLEESVMRAVRSGNAELLDSLLDRVRADNFDSRHLALSERRDLMVELRGTALRLLGDLPTELPEIGVELDRSSEEPAGPESLETLAEVFRSLMAAYNRSKKSHNTSMVDAIRRYVASSYPRTDLGLTVIAEAFGISENYLSNFFKEQTGETLSGAIQCARFAEATRLLLETAEPVAAVSAKCGYANVSSFRRAFKRWHGISPSEQRRRGAPSGRMTST